MRLFSGIVKKIYWPLCRAYSRHLGDRPADELLRFVSSLQYWVTYKFWPNFSQPRRFTEKVWHRLLYERDPILTLISDKYLVRDYVASKIGKHYLIPLLWEGDKPSEIPFDQLPISFVIKANHGCAYNIIVRDKRQLDHKKVTEQLRIWMSENFGLDTFLGIAWGYKNIKPHIIIEAFLGEDGKVPVDYKFFCFSGRVEFFKIDFDRFEGHSERFFDRELNSLGVYEVGLKLNMGKIELPTNIDEMISVADLLSDGFNFIRVDLYNTENKIYFSELTPYPGGTSAKFEPDSYDYVFGDKWK